MIITAGRKMKKANYLVLLLACLFTSFGKHQQRHLVAAMDADDADDEDQPDITLPAPETVCSNDVVILSYAEDICGQTLVGPTKYFIDANVATIYCDNMDGPILTDGAVLNCNGTTIQGDYDPDDETGAFRDGIEMQGDSIVENCIITNFGSKGIRMTGPAGPMNKKIVYNTSIRYSRSQGIYIDSNDDNQFINVNTYENRRQGVLIDGNGNNKFKYLVCNSNGSNGFQIQPTATGDNTIYNSEVRRNNNNGILIRGTGYTQIIDTETRGNDQDGIIRAAAASGPVKIKGGSVRFNARYGIHDLSRTMPYYMTILGADIRRNGVGGIRNIDSLVQVSCSDIRRNDGFGLFMGGTSAVTKIDDTDISDNGSENIDFNAGTATMNRVRACDAPSNVEVADAASVDLSLTTCDGNKYCGFTCDECNVEIPTWCEYEEEM